VEGDVAEMRSYIAGQPGSEGSAALVQGIRVLAEELNGMVIRAVATA
jgi:hypothetical protein